MELVKEREEYLMSYIHAVRNFRKFALSFSQTENKRIDVQ